ncbi:MAG: chain length determinant protein EpsF [Burkholderiales bacterium]
MNPKQLLLILRARWWLALLLLVLSVAGTYSVSLYLPKKYSASTSLVVDVRSRDPIAAMLMPSSMATQEDIIRSDRVAQKVVKNLRLADNDVVRQQWREATGGRGRLEVWLAELLQKQLTITPPRRDSNILTLEYTAVDPVFAAAVANAFAQAYVEAAVELRIEPARQYALWFGEQGKLLRVDLEGAQARLSEFQQKKGIVAKEENLDTEMARLAELAGQLTAIQAQTVDARSKQRSDAEMLPEVMGSSVVAGLRADIARHEAKLKDASNNLGRNHPQFRSMEAELAELKANLAAETRFVASSFSTTRSVSTDKERALKAAIEAQKRKLLELRTQRDQLAVLQRDVDAAKSAYDTVAARYTQASLESQATQTNVTILSPATEPLEASSPRIMRYTAMAVFFGLLLGLGAAFLWELLDRRVRCVEDLAEMLQMPVLGVVKRDKRPRRLRGPEPTLALR